MKRRLEIAGQPAKAAALLAQLLAYIERCRVSGRRVASREIESSLGETLALLRR
jgi:hypothetical protein